MYYKADCSSSGLNPHSVTFYLDSSCSTVATSAANQPFTPPGTTAALEYPCVQMTATTSISAGMWNEALWGIGSVLVWTTNNNCQGMKNADGSKVVRLPAFPIARVLFIRVFKCLLPHNHTCRPSRPPQVNFLPNDGECVRPSTFPANEFSTSVLGGKPVSWRFFLNKNSAACKGGTTTTAMIPSGRSTGGVSVELPFSHQHPALAPL